MRIDKFVRKNHRMITKALRFFKGNKVSLVISYSRALGGRKWHDNNKRARYFGYFKSIEHVFIARALVIGKHKFSLLISNNNTVY
jgi:hypothetical protein